MYALIAVENLIYVGFFSESQKIIGIIMQILSSQLQGGQSPSRWLSPPKTEKNNSPSNHKSVGMQLEGTNNVAVAEPVFNSKGQIVNFNIMKGRNRKPTHPTQTLKDNIDFISSNQPPGMQVDPEKILNFIGIACFCPICLDKQINKIFGTIATTPSKDN